MNKNSTFELEIKKYGKIIYPNVGDSMLPIMKEHQDLAIIEDITKKLKKYDVVLYKRVSGQYVLHRIMKIKNNNYAMCGDNRYRLEYPVYSNQIIGILTGIVHNDKLLTTRDKIYKIYVFFWCRLFYLRVFILKINHILKKIRKRLVK